MGNINKDNAYLIKQKKIMALTCEGRKGLESMGPFDVIHVGGAMEKVPKELED